MTPRSEGQRLLGAVPESAAAIARRLGTARQVVSAWRTGAKVPGARSRRRLEELFSIDALTWDRAPGDEQPEEREPLDLTPKSALEEVNAVLNRIRRDLHFGGKLLGAERSRLHDNEIKALATKARIERDQALLEDRIIREHPLWRRARVAILEALRPFPDAAKAAAAALVELDS